MSDEEEPQTEEETPKRSPIKAVVFSAAGALAMGAAAGGAAYFLAPSAKSCATETASEGHRKEEPAEPKDVVFVNLEPLVVTLGPDAKSRYLKISVSLETSKTHEKTLNDMSPRIRDTLNTYLRAVNEDDLVRPSGMTRIRAQMLRRLQLVAPSEKVSDVLITDFVLT